jgi:long-chain acyl-CoA synthetase
MMSTSAVVERRMPLPEIIRGHAGRIPDKPAIIWYGRAITYGELDELSDRCAAVLAGLGVCRGEPVALFMQNCPQYVIAHLAIQKLGAIVSPCSPLFKSVELAYQLGDLGAKVIIAADNLLPIIESARGETALQSVLVVHYQDFLPEQPTYRVPDEIRFPRKMPEGTVDLLQAMKAENDPRPPARLELDDIGLLVYTSGTTGRPKGAVLTLGNILFKTATPVAFSGLRKEDVHLAIPPLYHISGMLFGINIPLYSGATVVLHYRSDPLATLESIAHHRVTYWKGVAPMLVACMEAPGAERYDVTCLRITTASSFGIRMSEELSQRWAKFTNGCYATEAGYGLSETHTMDSMMPPDAVRWGTNGKLLPGVECRIVGSATGLDLPVGEQGEIVLRSPGNFRGYWNQPEKTGETLRDGWVHTGDIGKVDADGYLSLLGRTKEMIKVSGYSVFPEDVEAILVRHPKIAQAGVVGVADPHKGEVVKAVIVLKAEHAGTMTTEELVEWGRENMSAYKVPRVIKFSDALPKTTSGKVLRRLLKDA